MKLTIKNEFTGNEITVDTSKLVTSAKVKAWRRKLHADDCTSGDSLGGRGKQANQSAYDALLMRAEQVLMTE